VKIETTPAFDADYRRLKKEESAAFRRVVPDFAAGCDQFAVDPSFRWPRRLRVARLRGTGGLWEMTWSFASPDGRATFEFVRREGELVCRWRRMEDHGVFDSP
jgi:hypothetical protein